LKKHKKRGGKENTEARGSRKGEQGKRLVQHKIRGPKKAGEGIKKSKGSKPIKGRGRDRGDQVKAEPEGPKVRSKKKKKPTRMMNDIPFGQVSQEKSPQAK